MAVTTTIPLQSPEHRSSKSEIKPPFESQMAEMNNNNNNNNNNGSSSNNNNDNIINNKKAAAPRAMETGSTSEQRVGKSCHQCRQKFYSVAPDCHNTQRVRRLCHIKYCSRCLWNRYAERTEEVMLLPDWECPLCRGICNCSQCMKKSGKSPTGKLPVKGGHKKVDEERKAKRPRKIAENVGGELPPTPQPLLSELVVREATRLLEASMRPVLEPQLPRGVELTVVNNVPVPTEDAGNAMHFVKFSSTFGEILNFEHEPETILNTIFHGLPDEIGPVVLCQIRLLAVIMDPRDNPPLDPVDGDRCWLRSLNDCVLQSELRHAGLQPLNLTNNAEYAALSPSERLRILVLLCDESLQAAELRKAMEDKHNAFIDGAKEARNSYRAARDKEEKLKKKVQQAGDEKEKNGEAPPTHENGDAARDAQEDPTAAIRAEIAASQALLAQFKQKPEVLRVEPLLAEASSSGAHVYWRMGEGSRLLRQDLEGAGPEEWTERWHAYDNEEEKVMEKHIAANRTRRRRLQRRVEEVEVSSDSEDTPEDAMDLGPSQREPGPSQHEPGPSQEEPGPSHVEPEPDHHSPSLEG